jgi:hypothetical protein
MAGFDPAWFVATGIGVAGVAIALLLPERLQRKVGLWLFGGSILLVLVGVGGIINAYFREKPRSVESVPSAQPKLAEPESKPVAPVKRKPRYNWQDKRNWRQGLRVGMTRTEVKRVFGDPEHISRSEDIEDWDFGSGSITFFVSNENPDGWLHSWIEPSD